MLPPPLVIFLAALGKAAGDRAGRDTVGVLRELLGVQQAQEQLLRQLNVKVDALLIQPYETGRRQMRDALAHWREPEDRSELLKGARTSFMQAQSHPAAGARAMAGVHLAAVWAALDSPLDVRRALRDAHLDALAQVEAERRRATTGVRKLARVLDSPIGAAPAPRAVIPLANHIAMTRRDWGEPHDAAPVVVGFAVPERPPPGLRPVEQARWLILNTGSWGLSVGGIDYSAVPMDRREAESDECVAWIDAFDRGRGTISHNQIAWWLENEPAARRSSV